MTAPNDPQERQIAESVAARWVPDYWLIITRRRFRWHWELRNLVAVPWASGTARTFEEAKEAGAVRAEIGPTGYLPERPNPGIPEAWPRVNYLPIKVRRNRRHSDGVDLCVGCHHQRRSHWPDGCNYAECDCTQFDGQDVTE